MTGVAGTSALVTDHLVGGFACSARDGHPEAEGVVAVGLAPQGFKAKRFELFHQLADLGAGHLTIVVVDGFVGDQHFTFPGQSAVPHSDHPQA